VTMKLYIVTLIFSGGDAVAQRARPAMTTSGARTITIVSEPKGIVWIDEIRRGVTNDNGRLSSLKLSTGVHNLRVRAMGFKESAMPISAAQRGEITIHLVRTNDQAELIFQK